MGRRGGRGGGVLTFLLILLSLCVCAAGAFALHYVMTASPGEAAAPEFKVNEKVWAVVTFDEVIYEAPETTAESEGESESETETETAAESESETETAAESESESTAEAE